MNLPMLPQLDSAAHKYSRGQVVVIAGSEQFPGAAVLAIGGARCAGAGYVRFVCPDADIQMLVLQRFPDVVVSSSVDPDMLRSADAWAIGSGIAVDDSATQSMLHHILRTDAAVVIDGGMLGWFAADASARTAVEQRSSATILTPHVGEAVRMGAELGDKSSAARAAASLNLARHFNAIAVLKGAGTVVANPSQVVSVDALGGPELASAGTGDILAGLIAGMAAAHHARTSELASDVAVNAVHAHSWAGKLALKQVAAVTALDVLEMLPRAVTELARQEVADARRS